MAELQNLFQQISTELSKVTRSVNAQGINSQINTFQGNAKEFQDWVQSIEKYCTISQIDNAKDKILIAYQASNDHVNKFIQRYLGDKDRTNWTNISEKK